LLIAIPGFAGRTDTLRGPRVLLVDAHPDDEGAYAATVYKIVHDMHGVVDLVVITNGEGGYKYSTLAEPYYGLDLTKEAIGRKYLPAIRKKEQKNAGKILGLNHIYFLDQKDNRYMLNAHEVLDSTIWDTLKIERKLISLLKKGDYDYCFTLVPTDSTHGHHKAASILALRAVSMLPATKRPIILAATTHITGKPIRTFHGLSDYPITAVRTDAPEFSFDRNQQFGYRHVLNYKIISNWEIAEHKSQGTVQLEMNNGDEEQYWLYAINPASAAQKTKALFDSLAVNRYPDMHYPGEIR
jgi:LmbE family N-acetylglucosaminyl deacetylase